MSEAFARAGRALVFLAERRDGLLRGAQRTSFAGGERTLPRMSDENEHRTTVQEAAVAARSVAAWCPIVGGTVFPSLRGACPHQARVVAAAAQRLARNPMSATSRTLEGDLTSSTMCGSRSLGTAATGTRVQRTERGRKCPHASPSVRQDRSPGARDASAAKMCAH